jgi:arylsulfatase A-like enzyme
MRKKRLVACLVALGMQMMLPACGGGGGVTNATPAATPVPLVRPNVVVVVADDMARLDADQMNFAVDTLASKGLTFSRMLVAQSLCSPSRASILTGMQTQNHGVWDNVGQQGGFSAYRAHEADSLPVWLERVGYFTGLVGKYHNNYYGGAAPDGYVPPGWNEWHAHITSYEDGRYFNYWMNHNGAHKAYRAAANDYSADVEAKLAVEFVKTAVGQKKPFFLYVAPQAPHDPARYAERHAGDFPGARAPDHLPSFNFGGDRSHAPSWVRQREPFTADDIRRLHETQRNRLRSLRAVEDQIAQVNQALAETGQLENTYIFFIADNGLLMGQHRGNKAKGNAYEESLNVPFIVRGPGVPVGTTDAFVSNIDIAPTILELAGVSVPGKVDGRSLVPFLRDAPPTKWRTDLLSVNFGGTAGSVSHTLRREVKDGIYAGDWMLNLQDTGGDDHPYSGDYELYCMRGCAGLGLQPDPSQVRNLFRRDFVEQHRAFVTELRARLTALSTCSGASCRS